MHVFGFVYIIRNLVDGKVYIGQTTKASFELRYQCSKWWIKSHNKYLKRAAAKHGHTNFAVEILQYCYSREELDDLEKRMIYVYSATDANYGYNTVTDWTAGDEKWKQSVRDGIAKYHADTRNANHHSERSKYAWNEERRKRQGEISREFNKDPVFKEKLRNVARNTQMKPENALKRAANFARYNADPAVKQAKREQVQKRNADPEFQRKVQLVKAENRRRVLGGLEKMAKEEKVEFLATRDA